MRIISFNKSYISFKGFLDKLTINFKISFKKNPLFFLSYFILGGLLVWMCIIPGFLTLENSYILLHRIVQLGLLSMGMTLVIITGGIDLSVGSILALTCSLTGYFQHWGTWYGYIGQGSFIAPEPVILLMILGIGGLVGMINGVVSGIGIPDFAVTLGMMISIRGAAYAITGGMKIFGLGPMTNNLAKGSIGSVPYVFFIFIGILIILSVFERKTAMGKSIFAIGENPRVAKLSGISYLKTKMTVYIISGILAGMAGWILAGRLDTGDPKVGVGLELDAIAAVIIGGTNLYGGFGGVEYTIPGVLIIILARNLMALYGISSNVRLIGVALLLLVFLVLQRLFSRK